MKPYKLYVSKAGEVEVDEAKFTITNVSDADLGISVVGAPPGYFQLEIPEKVSSGGAVECKLKVNPEYLSGAFEKSITLEFSDAANSRFTIPVVRRLIGSQNIKKTPPTTSSKGGH